MRPTRLYPRPTLLALALLAAIASPGAFAATITVDPTAPDAPMANDGKCSLREAVMSINAGTNQMDCVADITEATVTQLGPDRVRLAGVRGHPRPPTLKALAYFDGGWLGEAEISYAGPNAEARARLAMDVMQRRLGARMPLRFDLIGVLSILGDDGNRQLQALPAGDSRDVRLRVASRHEDVHEIDLLLREVTALWTGGPGGGGGVRTAKRQRLSNRACFIAREQLPARYTLA